MRRILGWAALSALLLLSAVAQAAPQAKVGDVVWAQWRPNAWYHGKVDTTCPLGLHVAFDDGDQACLAAALVAVDQPLADTKGVTVGTRLLAKWSDGRYYPATAKAVAADGVSVGFDDGAESKLAPADLRLAPDALPPVRAAVGDVVFAQWKPNAWYHGKVDATCDLGLHVAFDDGDLGCYAPALVVVDKAPAEAPKPGARVLAVWSDGKFYPATVTAAAADGLSVGYDDGATGKVAPKDVRLR